MSARVCGKSCRAQPTASRLTRRPRGESGQGLVEFALILFPLILILMGIIQMGFIFNAQVTLTNAVREAARAGTIYVYDSTKQMAANDAARNELVRTTLLASMNMLRTSAPQFDASAGTWSTTGTATTGSSPTYTYKTGDLKVGYDASGVTATSETRAGEKLTVTATYHQDMFFPLFKVLLPVGADGRLKQVASVTMVVN